MNYQVSRSGQVYGPYTLEDVQRYVATGNILPTDLAKSEEMPDWVPVSQLLAGSATVPPPADPGAFSSPGFANPAAQPAFTPPAYTAVNAPAYTAAAPAAAPNPAFAASASTYPDAPNLHWGLYLLFSIITCGYFSMVFTVVQAAWLKKVQPNSQGLIFYIATYVLWVINKVRSRAVALSYVAYFQHHGSGFPMASAVPFAIPLGLLYLALLITSRFVMRNSLQEHFNTVEPIGLDLNPVMTFFFGGVYFQAELNRINAMKQAARMGTGRAY